MVDLFQKEIRQLNKAEKITALYEDQSLLIKELLARNLKTDARRESVDCMNLRWIHGLFFLSLSLIPGEFVSKFIAKRRSRMHPKQVGKMEMGDSPIGENADSTPRAN